MIIVYNRKNNQYFNNDYYIGRPSLLGNPFTHKKDTLAKEVVQSVDEAIDKYSTYIREEYQKNDAVKELINEIKTKHLNGEEIHLGCWCKPNKCHGDVIKDFINELIMIEQFKK